MTRSKRGSINFLEVDSPLADYQSIYESSRPKPTCRRELERILALPSLSKTSALLLSGAYYRLLDAPDLDRHWADWRPFVVDDLVDETDSVRSFVLRPVDAGPRTGHALPCCARPGSAVLVLDA
jgi:hypothetical protein